MFRFSSALPNTRTSIQHQNFRLLQMWLGCFFFLGSFIHQRIKQEQKSYAYCEVDNIRCKFDKCTKFFFLLSGVLCITSRGDSRPPTDFIRFFSERTASSLRICQDVHYIPFRWFSVRVFVFFYTLLWLLMLISFLFLMRFLQLKSETQGNELYSKYFHLNTCYSIVIWLNYSTLHTFLNIYNSLSIICFHITLQHFLKNLRFYCPLVFSVFFFLLLPRENRFC